MLTTDRKEQNGDPTFADRSQSNVGPTVGVRDSREEWSSTIFKDLGVGMFDAAVIWHGFARY
jgi:hypothetical protein